MSLYLRHVHAECTSTELLSFIYFLFFLIVLKPCFCSWTFCLLQSAHYNCNIILLLLLLSSSSSFSQTLSKPHQLVPDLGLTSVTFAGTTINVLAAVRDLGAVLDCQLVRDAHVSAVVKSCNFHLYLATSFLACATSLLMRHASCACIGHVAAGLLQ